MTRERIAIPVGLHVRMVEMARDFRKAPTTSERELCSVLRRDQLGVSFRRQQPIGPFVVDFFCAGHRLIVEVDSPIHESQQERDAERQRLLEACGYRVVRFTASDVEQNLPQVIAAIIGHISILSSPPRGGGAGGGGGSLAIK